MLKEALDYVYGKAGEFSAKQKASQISFLSTDRKIVYEQNGTILTQEVPPPLRRHTVDSVFDLIAAANNWGKKGTIWLSRKEVQLIIDDADRRESVSLPLETTGVFDIVCKLAEQAAIPQADFIRLLRRELRNSPQATTVLAAVRQIKFRSSEEGYSNINHGNESMGRSVEAEVTNAADIGDSLTLPLACYANPGEKDNVVVVAFTLDVEVQKQRFIVKPLPDEITLAYEQSLGDIRKRIVAALPETPVLYGRP